MNGGHHHVSGPGDSPLLEDLCGFLDGSPTPYHTVESTLGRLVADGFVERDLEDSWDNLPPRVVVRRGGTLICWQVQADAPPDAPFRIVGAHTDSPGFRIKPRPDASSAGWQQLGVEVYGGPLLNSWLDRDLGIAGRVTVGDGSRPCAATGPRRSAPAAHPPARDPPRPRGR